MSLRPTDFIKDTFRNSLKILWLTIVTFAGNEILMQNYTKAYNLFILTMYIAFILLVTYFPAFLIFLREQYTAYYSFKKYSPSVQQLDNALGQMKEEYLTNTLAKLPENDFKSDREIALEETIKRLEKQIGD